MEMYNPIIKLFELLLLGSSKPRGSLPTLLQVCVLLTEIENISVTHYFYCRTRSLSYFQVHLF